MNRECRNSLLCTILTLIGCVTAGPPTGAEETAAGVAAEPRLRKLLSDNPAAADVAAVRTGVTYTYDGYTVHDPAGGSWPDRMRGRALFDGGKFGGWWSTTECGGAAGTLYVDFDLRDVYRVDEVEVEIREAVDAVSVALGPEAQPEAAHELQAVPAGHYVIEGLDTEARYMRLAIRKKEGPLHVSEVRIWGCDLPADLSAADIGSGRRDDMLVLAEDGRPCAAIVVGRAASGQIRDQAAALQQFVEAATGATLPLVDDRASGLPDVVICVGPSELTGFADEEAESASESGSLVSVTDGKVILAGARAPRPVERARYAVHGFLRAFGAERYRGDSTLYLVQPRLERLSVPVSGVRVPLPAFLSRSPCSSLSSWSSGGGAECAMAHNWSQVVPHDKHGEAHPEYFGLLDGKRHANVLCTTEPAVIELFAEAAAAAFERGATAFSLTPNDGIRTFCQCERCVPDPDAAAPDADRLVGFANAVRGRLDETSPEHKDSKLHILAGYGWPEHLVPPSAGMKALPGVVLWMAHQGCHAHCWDDPDCPINRAWAEHLRGWLNAAREPIGIYEYACFSNYNWDRKWASFPVVSVRRVCHDIRAYRDAGVGYIYYESEAHWPRYIPFRWVNAYATDRALAEPDLDPNELLGKLCRDLYGNGAETMTEYYELLQSRLDRTAHHAGNWYLPDPAKVYSQVRPELDGGDWAADVGRLTELVKDAVWQAQESGAAALERCLEAQKVWFEAVASLRAPDRNANGPKQFREPPW